MAAFIPPRAFVPAAVTIRDDRLWAPPSEALLSFPVPGAWRSFAESDPADIAQIEAIARRFGGLTPEAATEGGEPLCLWAELISYLRELAGAWTETGAPADRVSVARARLRINPMLLSILLDYRHDSGLFDVKDGHWALRCSSMAHWWLLTAIADVQRLDPMRRCRHCDTWFSLTGLRADAGFCSPAHRSAFYQKRLPASRFWAEVA